MSVRTTFAEMFKFINIASFTTNDTGTTGSSSWTVDINVPCAGGCSLTPGYWKTHSEFGPAPYDDTWAQLPNGASTPFYLSGKTYYQVLWTAPQGNAYYILAHAFIAAKLNGLNGADTSAISSQLDWAEAFFAAENTYYPAQQSRAFRGSNQSYHIGSIQQRLHRSGTLLRVSQNTAHSRMYRPWCVWRMPYTPLFLSPETPLQQEDAKTEQDQDACQT